MADDTPDRYERRLSPVSLEWIVESEFERHRKSWILRIRLDCSIAPPYA